MKLCPSCSTQNKDLSKFCASCGKKLPNKTMCPYCNKEVKQTHTFCRHCGKSLREEKQKPGKKKLSKLKISLISIGAFIGLIIIVFTGLFIYARYYLVDQYTFRYNHTGWAQLVKKEDIPEFSATGLQVCESINENTFAPTNSKNEFEEGFREIYATVSLEGVTEEDLINFKWIREDSGEVIYNYTYNLALEEGYFSGNTYFPLVIPPEEDITDYQIFSQPGNYRVEFYHNEKLVDTAPFEVVATPAIFKEQVVFDTFDAETAKPLNVMEDFGPESNQLLSGIHLSGGIEEGDDFQFVLKDEKGQILKDNKANYYDLTKKDYFDDSYIYFYIYGPYSDKELTLEPGNYTVEFLHNGKVESSSSFRMTPPHLGFGNLILAKDTDNSNAPVEPTFEFILGTKKICATIYVHAAGENDTWKFIWKDREKVIKEFEDVYYVNEGEYFDGYKNINLYIPEGQGIDKIDIFGYPGEYLVEFYHNGNLIDSQRFEVVDEDISFGDLIISRDVSDTDDSPINPASEFNYGIEQIFAAIDIEGADLEDECRFVWINKDSDEIIRDFTYKYSENQVGGGSSYNGYFAMGIGLREGEELESHDLFGNPGNYIVNFYHNGYLMSNASFKIIK